MAEFSSNEELIEQYHQKLITKSEFDAQLVDNAELAILFEQYEADMNNVNLLAKEDIKAQTIEILARKRRLKRLWLLVGSVLIILFTVYFSSKTNFSKIEDTGSLYATYYETIKPSKQRNTNSADQGNTSFERALVAFSRKDYLIAITDFEETLSDSTFSRKDEALLYVGISNLEENQVNIAVEYFSAISSESYYYEEAEWYLALSLLKVNRLAESKIILQKIASDTKHYKTEFANELVNKIEQIR